VLAVGVAAALTWAMLEGPMGEGRDAPSAATTTDSGIPMRPADAFALIVTYVFDGDTIEARIARPNDIVPTTDPVRVRLIGVDTPEDTPTPECWADQARTHLRTLLPAGASVWASPDEERRDRYDRVLLYLWTDDGRFVNHELVAAGDGEAIAVGRNDAHFALLTAAENAARAASAGHWGSC
jgi:micrococcal nuclease